MTTFDDHISERILRKSARTYSKPSNAEATQLQTIKIDDTPVVTFGPPVPAANSNGWNNGTVTMSYTIVGATSGVVSPGITGPLTLLPDGLVNSPSGDESSTI